MLLLVFLLSWLIDGLFGSDPILDISTDMVKKKNFYIETDPSTLEKQCWVSDNKHHKCAECTRGPNPYAHRYELGQPRDSPWKTCSSLESCGRINKTEVGLASRQLQRSQEGFLSN